ncbi:MAG: Smr/MutS family protein [Paracoccaceae bacterium]
MKRRKLRQDEIDLWKKVVEQTDRLHPQQADPVRAPVIPKPKPSKTPLPRIEAFDIGQSAKQKPQRPNFKPAVTDRLAALPLQMDQKAFAKMKRGRIKPEGRLDLHGMRIDTAHPALVRFILSAQNSGKRLVLVITGKGKDRDEPGPIPTPRGVLRNQVPQWLSLPPLAQAVLQVTPAHVSHGGDGAYYVYLRRSRGGI